MGSGEHMPMELLSPAGSWEAMVAAVQCGADAVYLGCGALNARRGAKNFTPQELPSAVAYCHLRGVKVYLTLNTLISDRELPQAEAELRTASRCGVDAVIVQDMGLAALARTVVPDLPLHGSTQMTIHSLEGVERAAEMGFQCAVLGRELDRDAIRTICAHSPIPIEIFAHGALCMCISGQCAMSAVRGGRSGNRGLCAQPCRLPYRLDRDRMTYPLSLKDLCLAPYLRELAEMGVRILKLEGRMKRPEYVAVVTRIYAALLREERPLAAEELRDLTRAFSRDGFTDSYWQGHTGASMFGVRPEHAPEPEDLFQAARAGYAPETARTTAVTLSAEIRRDRPAMLTVSDRDGSDVTVMGDIPQAARTRPLTEADVVARLSKTGGTVFRVERVAVTLEEGLSLPAKSINALRRNALDRLAVRRTAPPSRREAPAPTLPENAVSPSDLAFTVSLFDGAQLTEDLVALGPRWICLPAERIETFDLTPYRDRVEFCVTLPRVCKDSERDDLRHLLARAKEKGCHSVGVGNLGLLDLAGEMGFLLRGDPGLNVFNSRSLEQLAAWGLASAALSFELRWEQIRDLRKPIPCEALIYGRLPLMVTENCVIANALGCRAGDLRGACRTPHTLEDRKGEHFPVLPVFGCRNEIVNGQCLFLADKPEICHCGLSYGRLRFTTETPEMCVDVYRRYRGQTAWAPETFTRGLFYRGVA